jgi:2-methylcitrate dehydratase PrpD
MRNYFSSDDKNKGLQSNQYHVIDSCLYCRYSFVIPTTKKGEGTMFTSSLCDFIYKTNYDDLPAEVVKAAKLAILDYLGVAMAGSREPSGKIITDIVRQYQSVPEATVIGGKFKAGCAMAALVNGTAGHVLDYDDCLDFPDVGLAHPTTSLIPAAMACGEKLHISGRDLITAYCLGLEAYAKIGLLRRKAFHSGSGWEWTGVLGVMGSAAAVAKVLKLDTRKTEMALGIAASSAGGLTRNFGTMAGHLHAGNAARNGVEAAILASKGYDAVDGVVEIASGFYNLFAATSDSLPSKVIRENIEALGHPWNLLDPGLMFKAFPIAHISHFGVEAALQLRNKYIVEWQKIAAIEFRIPPFIQRAVWHKDPKTGIQGKFGLGYCLCRALVQGKINISDFTDEAVKDPVIRQLMNKITWGSIEQDAGAGPFGCQEVVLKINDGREYSCKVEHPRGEPQNPLTQEGSETKYHDCAVYAQYPEQTISEILEMVMNLEKIDDISRLTALL